MQRFDDWYTTEPGQEPTEEQITDWLIHEDHTEPMTDFEAEQEANAEMAEEDGEE